MSERLNGSDEFAGSMRGAVWVLFLVIPVVILTPLIVVTIPPLHDYPFHLARADAIAVLAGQIHHATHYRFGSFLLPNVAMDVVTLGLTAVLPPLIAGRVFLGIVLLTLLGGTVALHRALHGRLSPWPLLSGFFLYNWIFLYGFTNYLFGVGMMLWGVAAWLAVRRANLVWRLLTGTVVAVAILFCHLVAFGLFAVVLGGLAISDIGHRWRSTRTFAVSAVLVPAVPVVVALAVFVALSPTAGEAREPITYYSWVGWKPMVAWRTPLSSIPWLDVATIGPLAVLLTAAVWRRWIRISPVMTAPVLLLGLTFLLMPYGLFGSMYADARLPIAVLLVVIASLDVRPPTGALVTPCVFVTAGLLLARTTAIAFCWHAEQPVIAEYEAAFAKLPAGSTLYAASTEPFPKLAYGSASELARWHPPLKHLASLASIGRDVFVPSTWADPFKQPIAVLKPEAAAKQLQGDNPFQTPTSADLADVISQIRSLREPGAAASDFLLLLRPEALTGRPPAGIVETMYGSTFTLYRIE